jgi:hypothetical protein
LKPLQECFGDEYESVYEQAVNLGLGKKVKAQDIWNKVIESQIETGVPYLCSKDNANKKTNHQNIGVIKQSNLCNEIYQYTDEKTTAICTLSSMVLKNYAKDGEFDFELLYKEVRKVVRALNKVIDINIYSTKKGKRGATQINVSSSYAVNELLNIGNFNKSKIHPYLTNAAGELISTDGTLVTIDPIWGVGGSKSSKSIAYVFGGAARYGLLDPRNINKSQYTASVPWYDHFKQVFQQGNTMNNSLNISGASDKSDYALSVSNNKTNKYKRIAKNFKANLDQIEETLATLKRLSQEENKTLQQNVKFIEKALKSKSSGYLSNLKTI